MSRSNEGIPDELRDVAERLRRERSEATALELDEIKLRVMARMPRSGRPNGLRKGLMRTRLVTLLAVTALLGGSAGAIAVKGGGSSSSSSNSSAAQSQYCPPTSQKPNQPKKPNPKNCGKK